MNTPVLSSRCRNLTIAALQTARQTIGDGHLPLRSQGFDFLSPEGSGTGNQSKALQARLRVGHFWPPRPEDRRLGAAHPRGQSDFIERCSMSTSNENDQADRAISTGKLHTLLRFHTQPINVVVFHDSQGILVFRLVSRLDAFSGYPFRI